MDTALAGLAAISAALPEAERTQELDQLVLFASSDVGEA